MQSFLLHWGYLALFALTALSAFCIPVGSELAMAYGGALASGDVIATGSHHHFTLALVIVVAVAGELFGSLCGYALGRFGGRALVDRAGRFLLLTHRDLDRAEAFMERRGDPFVLVGRLVPLLRSFVSVVAGLSEMALVPFVAFTLIGSAIFSAALASAGYALGSSYHSVVKGFSDAGYVAAAIAVVAIAVSILHRVKVLRAERAGATSLPR